MTPDEITEHARKMATVVAADTGDGPYAQACEFLRQYSGAKSAFLNQAVDCRDSMPDFRAHKVQSILLSFAEYVEAGLHDGLSVRRQARIDVVSDLLEQAHRLLDDNAIHAAAPIVLVGASLEEFLRNWVEDGGFSIGSRKPGIDSYSKVLRENDLLTKQDVKDITSWAGLRNSAAHGKWDEVKDLTRARIMLESVNLFMRRYGGASPS